MIAPATNALSGSPPAIRDSATLFSTFVAGVTPHPTQALFLECRAPVKVAACGRRWGKALALDTPIPTPDGWTTMGELCAEDLVFGGDGTPIRVLAVTDVMTGHTCYDVVFSDNSVITADADHLWLTLLPTT